jgi:hypothetical protein
MRCNSFLDTAGGIRNGGAKVALVVITVLGILGLSAFGQSSRAVAAKPRILAHSHNDYWRSRPLQDALQNGCRSVEADVYLVDGQLLVGHDVRELKPERTLSAMYLKPLWELVSDSDVFRRDEPFYLLIDVKSEAKSTYAAIERELQPFAQMLTQVRGDQVQRRPITAVISGNRDLDGIRRAESRLCGIDGRASDLDSNAPSHLIPMISDNWTSLFRHRGESELSPEEKQALSEFVRKCHDKGRVVRFWATPEKESLWKILSNHSVDLIGTDDPARLSAFLKSAR